ASHSVLDAPLTSRPPSSPCVVPPRGKPPPPGKPPRPRPPPPKPPRPPRLLEIVPPSRGLGPNSRQPSVNVITAVRSSPDADRKSVRAASASSVPCSRCRSCISAATPRY